MMLNWIGEIWRWSGKWRSYRVWRWWFWFFFLFVLKRISVIKTDTLYSVMILPLISYQILSWVLTCRPVIFQFYCAKAFSTVVATIFFCKIPVVYHMYSWNDSEAERKDFFGHGKSPKCIFKAKKADFSAPFFINSFFALNDCGKDTRSLRKTSN